MKATEAVAQLIASRDLGQRLPAAAHSAGPIPEAAHDEGQAVSDLLEQIDPDLACKVERPLNGQDARYDPTGSRNPDTAVPASAQPLPLLDSQAALAAASDAGNAQVSGQDLGWVAQGDAHLPAAHTASLVSGRTTSLSSHEGSIQVRAAKGPVSLHAHAGTLSPLAAQESQMHSVGDTVTVSAQTRIERTGDDSSSVLKSAAIAFTTPGPWPDKKRFDQFVGGSSAPAKLPARPTGLGQYDS